MVHYCLRRCTNDGVRTHVKYYTGNTAQVVSLGTALNDWVDYPDDINVAVMDSVLASNVMEHVARLTSLNRDVSYDIVSIDDVHSVSKHLEALALI